MDGWVAGLVNRPTARPHEQTGERGGNRRTDKNINSLEDGLLNE